MRCPLCPPVDLTPFRGHNPIPDVRSRKHKIRVIERLRNVKVISNVLRYPKAGKLENLVSEDVPSLAGPFKLHSAESKKTISVPLDSLKALCFVKSFEGSRDYNGIKFFEKQPPIGGLWVRVQFYDREYLEGITQNSLPFLVNHGFFMKPPEPHSNNKILYAVKSSLSDFRVLGVKST